MKSATITLSNSSYTSDISPTIPKGTKMTAKTVKEMERANLAKMLLMQSAGSTAE